MPVGAFGMRIVLPRRALEKNSNRGAMPLRDGLENRDRSRAYGGCCGRSSAISSPKGGHRRVVPARQEAGRVDQLAAQLLDLECRKEALVGTT